jgi:hypothetical protein
MGFMSKSCTSVRFEFSKVLGYEKLIGTAIGEVSTFPFFEVALKI